MRKLSKLLVLTALFLMIIGMASFAAFAEENVISTPYGDVPADSEYADATAYPFFAFKDGAFLKGYSTWKAMIQEAANTTGITVYMRRDYDIGASGNGELNKRAGNLVIDLGDHILSNSGSYGMNFWVTDADNKTVTVTIKNGTFIQKNKYPLLGIDYNGGSKKGIINLNLEGVTLKTNYTSAVPWGVISVCFEKTGVNKNTINITATDCTFDFTGAKSGTMMISAGTNDTNMIVAYNIAINGGKVIADDFSQYKLYTAGETDTKTFGKGTDGEYTVLQTPNKRYAPTVKYPSAEGELTFAWKRTEGTNSIYQLVATPDLPDETTPYGTISGKTVYILKESYPLAVFNNGNFVGAYANWREALIAGAQTAGSVVYLRRDYDLVKDQNLEMYAAKNDLVVDLGGHTITTYTYVANYYGNGTTSYDLDFVFKNGTFKRAANYVTISVEEAKPNNAGGMLLDLTYENITFANSFAGSSAYIFATWDGKGKPFRGSVTINVNNCVFDLSNYKSTNKAIFAIGKTANDHNVTLNINGGNIITNDLASFTFVECGEGDVVNYNKYNGSYITLTTNAGTPSVGIPTAEGTLYFNAETEKEGVYALGACTHSYDNGCDTTCNICGAEREITHNYEAVVTAPTCTEGGYTTYTCACGASYVGDETEPTDHNYDVVVTAPTCTEVGYSTYTCACGDAYVTDETPAKGHRYSGLVVNPATCTENGWINISCGNCGNTWDSRTDVEAQDYLNSPVGQFINITAKGHVYDNDFDADCNNCGETREVAATEGALNTKITWTYADGVLTINGKGKIKNFNANATPWAALVDYVDTVVIGEGITYVGASAFYGFTNVDTVVLPETLTAIGNYAFYGCSALNSVSIPENVTEIGAYAFRRTSVTTAVFAIGYGWSAGDNALTLEDVVAGGANYLTTVFYKSVWTRDVNAEAETIDPNFVDGGICGNNIKWTVTKLENGKLKLTVSGEGAMPKFSTGYTPWFGYAADIVEVEVTEGVTTIGRCAFYGLKFVRKATIADTVTAIDDYGFYMCFLLKSIELPEGVTIGKDAFTKTGIVA